MKVKTYREFGSLNSHPVFDAFEEGLRESGDYLVYTYEEADVVVIWSILFAGRMAGNKEIWERANNDNKPVIVLEVGALQRGTTWKMGVGGINNDAQWAHPNDTDRIEKLGLNVEPTKTTGEFITICTQRPDSHQWEGMPSVKDWVLEQIDYVHKLEMNIPVVVRPHPRDKQTDWSFLNDIKATNVYFDAPKLVEGTYDTFNHREIFDRSRIVINHSSGPAVQAALQGIDVICSPSSLAWDVALNNENSISHEEWIDKLAHTEFTTVELKTGEPWKNLKASVLSDKDHHQKPTESSPL